MEDDIIKIEIFGPGCRKCRMLEENTKIALPELGRKEDIIKVTERDYSRRINV